MAVPNASEVDSVAAQRIWEEFQKRHDLSGRIGQTAGIDPRSGRVWFGASIQEAVEQRDADGCGDPLYFVRIGSAAYYRKGSHR